MIQSLNNLRISRRVLSHRLVRSNRASLVVNWSPLALNSDLDVQSTHCEGLSALMVDVWGTWSISRLNLRVVNDTVDRTVCVEYIHLVLVVLRVLRHYCPKFDSPSRKSTSASVTRLPRSILYTSPVQCSVQIMSSIFLSRTRSFSRCRKRYKALGSSPKLTN